MEDGINKAETLTEKTGRIKRFRRALRVVFALIVIAVLVLWGIFMLSKPCDRTDATYRNVEIAEGSSLEDVAVQLEAEGIIRKASSFELFARLSTRKAIKPGTYFLSPSMDSFSIIKTLNQGLTTPKGFTIPAGYTVDQIATSLARDGLADKDVFLQAASSPALLDLEILEDPTGKLKGKDLVEGFLFPSEYTLSSDADEGMMVIMMIDAFTNFYNEDYQARADELGLTPRQVLIIASIIEKETSVDKERAAISGVLHNRYNLELLGENEIPAVPLCSPGEESIIAALYPEEHEYTHYVLSSKLDGTHRFTADDAEYEALLAEYNAAAEAKNAEKEAEKTGTQTEESAEGGE